MSLLCRLFLLVLAFSAVSVRADRDIVYAARYYTPPGSHRTSHFHLYRINPDGTGRTQLTFGAHDDTAPRWSPDGRRIAFTRDDTVLCVVRAGGGPVQALMRDRDDPKDPHSISDDIDGAGWLPDSRTLVVLSDADGDNQGEVIDAGTGETTGYITDALDYVLSPSGRYAYLRTDKTPNSLERIHGRSRRTLATLETEIPLSAWLGDQTLIGLPDSADDPAKFVVIGLSGKVRQEGQLHWAAATKPEDDPIASDRRILQTIPGDPHHVLFVSDQGNSTVRPKYDFYRMTVPGGGMGWFLRSRQFVAFSPDGSRYCTSPSRDLSPYSRRRYPLTDAFEPVVAQHRMVWTAPLQTGLVARRNLRTITPSLVWVGGADWRKRQP